MNLLVRPLLRIASLQGREVIEALVTGQFTIAKASGKVMTTATATNKSFSFTIDPSMSAGALMKAADEALAWFDSHTSDELAAFLTRRATNVAFNRYGAC